MPKHNVDVRRRTRPADPVSVRTGDQASPTTELVTAAATVGVIVAGVALLEAALIPGLLIGGAAVLAPKYVPKFLPKYLGKRLPKYLPKLPLPSLFNSSVRRPAKSNSPPTDGKGSFAVPTRLAFGQAVAKTITFRIIVTTLDFTVNYVVIGEVATAAGLSAFALVVGPLFYLAHETAWNYFGDADKRVDVRAFLRLRPEAKEASAEEEGFTISRALAKTITFRTIATTVDFTASYVVVGDLATAAVLSASGFFLGPFVYLGHEMAWDYFGSPRERTPDQPAPMRLLPAPA